MPESKHWAIQGWSIQPKDVPDQDALKEIYAVVMRRSNHVLVCNDASAWAAEIEEQLRVCRHGGAHFSTQEPAHPAPITVKRDWPNIAEILRAIKRRTCASQETLDVKCVRPKITDLDPMVAQITMTAEFLQGFLTQVFDVSMDVHLVDGYAADNMLHKSNDSLACINKALRTRKRRVAIHVLDPACLADNPEHKRGDPKGLRRRLAGIVPAESSSVLSWRIWKGEAKWTKPHLHDRFVISDMVGYCLSNGLRTDSQVMVISVLPEEMRSNLYVRLCSARDGAQYSPRGVLDWNGDTIGVQAL